MVYTKMERVLGIFKEMGDGILFGCLIHATLLSVGMAASGPS